MALTYTVTEEVLGEAVRRILAAGSPQKIILFGSRAAGTEKPDSDLDLLVIAPDGDRRDVHHQYSVALTDLGIPKDVVVVSPEEVAAWRNVRNYFLTKVVREGRVLYERAADRLRESGPTKDQGDHVRVWFRKGDSQLKAAETLLHTDGPYDTVCFHAQQAAEMYLKAVIAYLDLDIPRTHILEDLQTQLRSAGRDPGLNPDALKPLSEYFVTTRYKDFWPEWDEAERAVELAQRIRKMALELLPAGIVKA